MYGKNTVKIACEVVQRFKKQWCKKCGNIPIVRIVPGQGVVHTMVIDMEAIHRQRLIMGRLVDIMVFLFRQLTFTYDMEILNHSIQMRFYLFEILNSDKHNQKSCLQN